MRNCSDLLHKYLDRTITQVEMQQLLTAFAREDPHLLRELENEITKTDLTSFYQEEIDGTFRKNRLTILSKIQLELREKQQSVVIQTNYRSLAIKISAIAATIILFLSFGTWIIKKSSHERMQTAGLVDVEPGGNKAQIILQNGTAFPLSESNGKVNLESDQIVYEDGSALVQIEKIQQLELRTPIAGQYRIELNDGTNVWLNSMSSLYYPSRFTEKERKVKVVGEAYFEVAKHQDRPFIVELAGQQIKVLGTKFNTRAYDHPDDTKISLIEGSVELIASNARITLFPNQQACLVNGKYEVSAIESRQVTGWKDGYFRFSNTPLKDVLQELRRWYDIDIDCDHIPEHVKIRAVINRNQKLRSVIYALEEVSAVRFKLEGRRLTIGN